MGFVYKPQRSVKKIFMNKPGESLHAYQREYYNAYVYEKVQFAEIFKIASLYPLLI
jgi:hypothetical protein